MNILWIVNNVLPELGEKTGLATSASGSWLLGWVESISKKSDMNLAVAAVGGNEYKKISLNNITYYLLPGNGKNMLFYTKKYEKLWKIIKEDFKPDIVHLHGTEYSHGLSFLRVNPEVKAVVSVQGIISKIYPHYFDGLEKGFSFKYNTIRELMHLNNLFCLKMVTKKNSRYEKEIFLRVRYANTVNIWDESITKEFNSDIKCFRLEYNLRNEFYESEKWDIEKAQKHRIFTGPGGSTIKGLHILLKAICLVKKHYPDVSVVVPGMGDGTGKLVIRSGYTKYINKLLKKYNIEDNVYFEGRLSGEEMRQRMLGSNLTVVPSAMEGTSLVLRESMFLGVPTIAACRGGMADFISDKTSGFLYDFDEYPYLAHRIMEIFQDDEFAANLSKNAVDAAEKAHNRQKNTDALMDMYSHIYNS